MKWRHSKESLEVVALVAVLVVVVVVVVAMVVVWAGLLLVQWTPSEPTLLAYYKVGEVNGVGRVSSSS